MQEQQQYGGYTGSPQYDGPPVQQQYSTPPQGQNVPPPMYDDAFMDVFAQRLSQRMPQGPQGKIYPQTTQKERPSAGQRLALAIVLVVMFIPIAGVCVGLASVVGGFLGFMALLPLLWLLFLLMEFLIRDKTNRATRGNNYFRASPCSFYLTASISLLSATNALSSCTTCPCIASVFFCSARTKRV